MPVWTIYLLRDPDDPTTGYVGQTSHDPVKRRAEHFWKNAGGTPAKRLWLAGCRERGALPLLEILETCPTPATANYAEKVWIRKARSDLGMRLLNGLTGGQREYSAKHAESVRRALANPETRERMATAQRAAWADPAQRQRRIDGIKAACKRPETRKKKAAAGRKNLTGRWADPEARNKLLEGYMESWQTPERIEKQKAAWRDPERRKAWVESLRAAGAKPEYREKKRAQSRKFSNDPEFKARHSARMRERWADPEYKARVSAAISAAHQARRKA